MNNKVIGDMSATELADQLRRFVENLGPLSKEDFKDIEMFSSVNYRQHQLMSEMAKLKRKKIDIVRSLIRGRTCKEVGLLLGISSSRVSELARSVSDL